MVACSAVLAVCVVTASSATAAEFLFNGEKIAAGVKLAVKTTNVAGTLILLEDMKPPGGAVDILCNGWTNGEITGPENGDITEILNLTESSKALSCTYDTKGACEGTETTAEAVHLPWLITPLLSGTVMVIDHSSGGSGNPGYAVKCKTILGTLTDECSGESGAEGRNVATGLEGEFLEGNETITPPVECSLSKEKSGLEAGAGITTVSSGGVLALSE